MLDAGRIANVKIILYASSSSVYGQRTEAPFQETSETSPPQNFYAATKQANELMGYCYANIYKMRIIGIRYFTIYGPWGRPDMAPWIFTESIFNSRPIELYNGGRMHRSFTYIDDAVTGTIKLLKIYSKNVDAEIGTPTTTANHGHNIYNIGNSESIALDRFVDLLESAIGMKANRIYKPMMRGDIQRTHACVKKIKRDTDWTPNIDIEEGICHWVSWFRKYKSEYKKG
jgi:UDP-glucuronate 4-epimerase